jgi:hypothetical protein
MLGASSFFKHFFNFSFFASLIQFHSAIQIYHLDIIILLWIFCPRYLSFYFSLLQKLFLERTLLYDSTIKNLNFTVRYLL